MSNSMPIQKRVVRILPRTESNYKKTFEQRMHSAIARRSYLGEGAPFPGPTELVDDLIADSVKYSRNTVITYRAAIRWRFYIELKTIPAESEMALEIKGCLERLVSMELPKRGKSNDEINARRKRSLTIRESDLVKLEAALGKFNRKNSNNWGGKTREFFVAGIATGLRPSEWAQAKLQFNSDKSRHELFVISAKTKADPEWSKPRKSSGDEVVVEYVVGEPETVESRIVPIRQDDLDVVISHMKNIEEYGVERFLTYTRNCGRTLTRACHVAFSGKKLFGLYVARSQAAANLKAGNEIGRVREIMGHTPTSKSTTSNYGKRRSAHAKFKQEAGEKDQEAENDSDQDTDQETPRMRS